VALLSCVLAAPEPRPFPADPAKVCDSCAEWNAPREPFRVFGNTYYVGVGGITAILIASDAGHILVDGGLTQSAPLIDASIRKLGFRTEDVRLIVNSHAHFDHAGGLAALQRASGAPVAAGAPGALAIRGGGPTPDDPQYAIGAGFNSFPAVEDVRAVGDGEALRVGALVITAQRTPGHTPGGTTWTWRSCEEKRCVDVVYADSLTAVSAPEFRFSAGGDGGRQLSAFRRAIDTVAKLPCDVLLTPHPSASGLDEKLRRRGADPDVNPFVDRDACRAYAAAAARGLDRRLADEAAAAPVTPAR
jgi:metallo-beta-lactamase class B